MFVGRNEMFNQLVAQGWFYRVSQGAGKRRDLNITRKNPPLGIRPARVTQSTSLNLSNFLFNTLESGLEALDEFLDELLEGFRNGDTTKPFR